MDLHNWQTQVRKGILEMAVMNLLGRGECHGYEMVRAMKKFRGLEIREGNIYAILARLQIDGLIRTYTLASSNGPPRKYYKLTKAGEQILRRMNEHWDELAVSLMGIRSGGNTEWIGKTGSGES